VCVDTSISPSSAMALFICPGKPQVFNAGRPRPAAMCKVPQPGLHLTGNEATLRIEVKGSVCPKSFLASEIRDVRYSPPAVFLTTAHKDTVVLRQAAECSVLTLLAKLTAAGVKVLRPDAGKQQAEREYSARDVKQFALNLGNIRNGRPGPALQVLNALRGTTVPAELVQAAGLLDEVKKEFWLQHPDAAIAKVATALFSRWDAMMVAPAAKRARTEEATAIGAVASPGIPRCTMAQPATGTTMPGAGVAGAKNSAAPPAPDAAAPTASPPTAQPARTATAPAVSPLTAEPAPSTLTPAARAPSPATTGATRVNFLTVLPEVIQTAILDFANAPGELACATSSFATLIRAKKRLIKFAPNVSFPVEFVARALRRHTALETVVLGKHATMELSRLFPVVPTVVTLVLRGAPLLGNKVLGQILLKCPVLKALDVQDCPRLTAAGLANMPRGLSRLFCGATQPRSKGKMDDKLGVFLNRLDDLQQLAVRGCPDFDKISLKAAPFALDLTGSPVTEATGLTGVRHLSVAETCLDVATVISVSLHSLNLSGIRLDQKTLTVVVTTCTLLGRLHVARCRGAGDEVVSQALTTLPRLRLLDVSSNPVTERGVMVKVLAKAVGMGVLNTPLGNALQYGNIWVPGLQFVQRELAGFGCADGWMKV